MYSWQNNLLKKKEKDTINKIITNNITSLDLSHIPIISNIHTYILIIAKQHDKILIDILFYYNDIVNNTPLCIISKYNPFPLSSKTIKTIKNFFKQKINNDQCIIYNTKLNKCLEKQWWTKYYIDSKWSDNSAYIDIIHNVESGIYKFNQTKKMSLKKYSSSLNYCNIKKDQLLFIHNKIVTRKKIFNYKYSFKPWFKKMLNFIHYV